MYEHIYEKWYGEKPGMRIEDSDEDYESSPRNIDIMDEK